jgi:hypothetical protein
MGNPKLMGGREGYFKEGRKGSKDGRKRGEAVYRRAQSSGRTQRGEGKEAERCAMEWGGDMSYRRDIGMLANIEDVLGLMGELGRVEDLQDAPTFSRCLVLRCFGDSL